MAEQLCRSPSLGKGGGSHMYGRRESATLCARLPSGSPSADGKRPHLQERRQGCACPHLRGRIGPRGCACWTHYARCALQPRMGAQGPGQRWRMQWRAYFLVERLLIGTHKRRPGRTISSKPILTIWLRGVPRNRRRYRDPSAARRADSSVSVDDDVSTPPRKMSTGAPAEV